MVKCYRKSVALSDLWVSWNDKHSDFYASSWQRGESPVPLLVFRLLIAAGAMAVLVWALVEGASPYWLLYLTNWGLVLVTMMALSGALVSIMALCKTPHESNELPWYVGMYWLLFNISVPTALLITALYWILLYDPEPEEFIPRMFWLDVATHGFNSCIAVCELLISRTPVRVLHLYQSLGLGLWYASFSAAYYAGGGTDPNGNPFIYEILDWRQGRRAGAVVGGSVAALLVLYALIWGVALCRDKLSTALLRSTSHDLPRPATTCHDLPRLPLTPPDNLATRIV